MIVNCLRHWVEHMHVDGFRFDLAASLSRGEDGRPLEHPPILLDIEVDPVLAGTKIIAEAWDAAGLYQLANFGGDRWACGTASSATTCAGSSRATPASVGPLADNLVGSANLFGHADRLPSRSVNFITAHDGFTLNDLVTYDDKHNEANGEEQPRRHERQLQLELRRRRPDRRSGDRGPAPAADQELSHDSAVFRGPADAGDGRRGPTHAARQQQRLLPRQRQFPGSTGTTSHATPASAASPAV